MSALGHGGPAPGPRAAGHSGTAVLVERSLHGELCPAIMNQATAGPAIMDRTRHQAAGPQLAATGTVVVAWIAQGAPHPGT